MTKNKLAMDSVAYLETRKNNVILKVRPGSPLSKGSEVQAVVLDCAGSGLLTVTSK